MRTYDSGSGLYESDEKGGARLESRGKTALPVSLGTKKTEGRTETNENGMLVLFVDGGDAAVWFRNGSGGRKDSKDGKTNIRVRGCY